MDIKDAKIEIGNMTFIFNDAIRVEMLHGDLSGAPVPYTFDLRIETCVMPLVYRKIQNGNVTEYEKLS